MDRKRLKDLEYKVRLMIKESPDTMIKINHKDFFAFSRHVGNPIKIDTDLRKSYVDFDGKRVYVL